MVANYVVGLYAALILGAEHAPGSRDVIILDVRECPRNCAAVRFYHRAVRQELGGESAEAGRRDAVAGEDVANRAGPAWSRSRAARIVDGQQVSCRVHPFRKIPLVHLGNGDAEDASIVAGAVAKALIADEEESAVAAVVNL